MMRRGKQLSPMDVEITRIGVATCVIPLDKKLGDKDVSLSTSRSPNVVDASLKHSELHDKPIATLSGENVKIIPSLFEPIVNTNLPGHIVRSNLRRDNDKIRHFMPIASSDRTLELEETLKIIRDEKIATMKCNSEIGHILPVRINKWNKLVVAPRMPKTVEE